MDFRVFKILLSLNKTFKNVVIRLSNSIFGFISRENLRKLLWICIQPENNSGWNISSWQLIKSQFWIGLLNLDLMEKWLQTLIHSSNIMSNKIRLGICVKVQFVINSDSGGLEYFILLMISSMKIPLLEYLSNLTTIYC